MSVIDFDPKYTEGCEHGYVTDAKCPYCEITKLQAENERLRVQLAAYKEGVECEGYISLASIILQEPIPQRWHDRLGYSQRVRVLVMKEVEK